MSYKYFQNAYNELHRKKQVEAYELTAYYIYAELLLMYKLNQNLSEIGNGIIFKLENIIDKALKLCNDSPDFIKIYYLLGCVCEEYGEYQQIAKRSYLKTIKLLCNKKLENLSAFIYYRLGNLEVNTFKNFQNAKIYYKNAYKYDKYFYPALFELAEQYETKESINMYNQIICTVLNGYSMDKAMPKQQIYAYRAFKLLGDIFFKREDYIAAMKCYENARSLSKTKSIFWKDFNVEQEIAQNSVEGNIKNFFEIVKNAMPLEPILKRLVECATKINDYKKKEKYLEEYFMEK